MKALRILVVLLTLTIGWSQASAQQDDLQADCSSLEGLGRTAGLDMQIVYAHWLYPVVLESQLCEQPLRLSEDEFATVLQGVVVAVGCEPTSSAFEAMKPITRRMAAGIGNKTPETEGLPERYLSQDPSFCSSEDLIRLKACGSDLSTCSTVFAR